MSVQQNAVNNIAGISIYIEQCSVVAYFGIILGDINLKRDLFSDPTRGADYYTMYNFREHITLAQGSSVRDAFHRIRQKVLNMTTQKENSSAEMLDLVINYALRRQMKDETFSTIAIDELLLPRLFQIGKHASAADAAEERVITFADFCAKLNGENAVILGEQGGCGKTTFMTKLFFHYLALAKVDHTKTMIPLFIDARDLKGKDNLILRYLADKLFQEETARSDRYTSTSVSWLSNAFREETHRSRYLLLIDGCNELSSDLVDQFNKELEKFSEHDVYRNVRFILSGRTIDTVKIVGPSYFLTHLGPLEDKAIRAYLIKKQQTNRRAVQSLLDGGHLHHILKIPMFLRLYAETPTGRPINSKGNLIQTAIRRQEKKDCAAMTEIEDKALCALCLQHILPMTSYILVIGDDTQSRFSFTDAELNTIMETVYESLNAPQMKMDYGETYYKLLKNYKLREKISIDLKYDFIAYATQTCKLLRKTDDDRYEFVHQIYRDFFCGSYISQDILRSIKNNALCDSLIKGGIEPNIASFIADLLDEPRPFWDREIKRMNYGNESSSKLLSLLDLSRSSSHKEAPTHIANIIALLRIARSDDLSGIDFSGLNLTESNLRTSILARQFAQGIRAANFHNAVINPENLLVIEHCCPIRAACANERYMATLDTSGVIMLWDRSRPPTIPVKIIEQAECGFFKLLFAPDGQSFYGANDFQIMRIPIPETSRANANPEIILKTTRRFWDITLDKNGELCFTTAMNPYNPKPISNPTQPDSIFTPFDTRNSCAAINNAGTQLSYSFPNFRTSLRIYDYDAATCTWNKRKLGYGTLYDQYTNTIERFLKDDGLYEAFAADTELPLMTNQKPARLAAIYQKYSSARRGIHSGRNLQNYLNSITQFLKAKGITLSSSQEQDLNKCCTDATERYLQITNYGAVLLGRKNLQMRSVVYNSDDTRILIAYTEAHENKNADKTAPTWTHVISEINTATLEVYNYTRFTSNVAISLSAQYVHGGILVTTPTQVTIFGFDGTTTMQLECKSAEPKFLSNGRTREDAFFVFSKHDVYRLSSHGKCIMAFDNTFHTEALTRATWKHMDLLINSAEPKKTTHHGIDLANGAVRPIGTPQWLSNCRYAFERLLYLNLGETEYDILNGKLLCYRKRVLHSEQDIPLCLFVCGCDFRNVGGKLSMPEYLRVISAYGAITDPHPKVEISAQAGIPKFLPSKTRFIKGTYSAAPAVMVFEQNTEQPNNFIETDYSILAWTNRMRISTPEMILRLMESGHIEKSATVGTNLHEITQRMAGYLFRTKLLTPVENQATTNADYKRIYTVALPDGEQCLWRGIDTSLPPTEDFCRSDVQDIQRWLKIGNWFSQTVQKYANYTTDYAFYSKFRNKLRLAAEGQIAGYLKLGEQAFFAEPVQSPISEDFSVDLRNKVQRMCSIVCGWKDLIRFDSHNTQYQVKLSHVPILVFIGNSMKHCRDIHTRISSIIPNVRKIYTYTALLSDGYFGPMYFEFIGDKPHAVELMELIHPTLIDDTPN